MAKDKIPDNYKNMVETNFDQVRGDFTFTIGSGKERTKSSWSDIGFVDMAMHVGLKISSCPHTTCRLRGRIHLCLQLWLNLKI